MKFRVPVVGASLILVLAACSSTAAAPRAATDAPDADVTITSVDMAFDQQSVSTPAGEAFTLALINDNSMPHNVSIYTDEGATDTLFEGEYVTDGTIVYDIPALEPGEYFFRCDLHPEMAGALAVGG